MADMTFPDSYPETLQLVATAVFDYLTSELKLPMEAAASAAFGAAERVRQQVGGSKPYIAKGVYYEADQRAQQIYKKFNGRNIPELAREFKLTEERVRQILTERSEAERLSRQGMLFDSAN